VVSYPVRVVLESDDRRLRVGLTATAEIIVQEVRDVVLAPNWAIRRDRASGQAFASVLRAGQVQEIPVKLGLRNDAFSEVTEGLAAGDIVAIQVERQPVSLFGGP
jgi:HlyD family secretion protein